MPETGTRIGRYEILAKLGEGGMGEVYRARDEKLNREVAIKVLPVSFSADEDRLRRFEQEAQAAGALNHPNILAVYDIGTHAGAPYIVAELLAGQELRNELNDGALPPRQAIDYAQQITQGIAAAHDKGITHRDLKPENLFVTSDGRIKILDFGLAKLRPQRSDVVSSEIATEKQMTDPGTVMGTVGYHVTGTGARTGHRLSFRYFQLRFDSLRNAYGTAGLPTRDIRGNDDGDSQRRAKRINRHGHSNQPTAGKDPATLPAKETRTKISLGARSGVCTRCAINIVRLKVCVKICSDNNTFSEAF